MATADLLELSDHPAITNDSVLQIFFWLAIIGGIAWFSCKYLLPLVTRPRPPRP